MPQRDGGSGGLGGWFGGRGGRYRVDERTSTAAFGPLLHFLVWIVCVAWIAFSTLFYLLLWDPLFAVLCSAATVVGFTIRRVLENRRPWRSVYAPIGLLVVLAIGVGFWIYFGPGLMAQIMPYSGWRLSRNPQWNTSLRLVLGGILGASIWFLWRRVMWRQSVEAADPSYSGLRVVNAESRPLPGVPERIQAWAKEEATTEEYVQDLETENRELQRELGEVGRQVQILLDGEDLDIPIPPGANGREHLTTYLWAVASKTAHLSVAGAERALGNRPYCKRLIKWLETQPKTGDLKFAEKVNKRDLKLTRRGLELVTKLVREIKRDTVNGNGN